METNQLHEVITSVTQEQEEIGLVVETMTAIQSISEGKLGWHWRTQEERLVAISALSGLMQNFAPCDPVRLRIVRSQFGMQRSRAPEAFELCPALVRWAQQDAAKS